MKTRFSSVLLFSLFFLAQPLGLWADTFRFSADRKSGTKSKGRELIVLEGNVQVDSDTLKLEAERIEISGDDMQVLDCTGGVRGVDEERGLYFFADSLHYDRINKLIKLSGNATMEDKKNEVVAKARRIEYNEDLGTSLLQVGVRLFKGELVCRSDYAFWRREEKDLELYFHPVVFKGGDEFRAERMRIDLDSEELLMEGRVSGKLKTESDESEKSEKSKKPKESKKETELKESSEIEGEAKSEEQIEGEEPLKGETLGVEMLKDENPKESEKTEEEAEKRE